MIDVNDRVFVANMVKANYHFNWRYDQAAGLSIVDQYGGRATALDWRKEQAREVNWFWCETPAALFFFFGGVNDQAARGECIAGWMNDRKVFEANGFNPFAWNLVQRYKNIWPIFKNYRNKQVIFVGQSGGGMCCEAANFYAFGREDRPNDCNILTGTPRGLHKEGTGFYSTGKTYRFMMVMDPIICLPPRMEEWPELCYVFSGFARPLVLQALLAGSVWEANNFVYNLWPGFHHPPGGIVLFDDGRSYERHDLPPPRSTTPITGGAIESCARLFSYPQHEMATYVAAVGEWARIDGGATGTLTPEAPGEVAHGDWGNRVEFFCPMDDFGNIVNSPNGRVQVANSIVQTGSVPLADGSLGGSLYLRGQLVATFPTVGRARTAASRLNRFLAKLPSATEVSTSGLSDGMLQYLAEAAIGGGVDKRPVKVVT